MFLAALELQSDHNNNTEAYGEPVSFLQSRFWGDFKSKFGWTPLCFTAHWMVPEKGTKTHPLLVLARPLITGLKLAYIPWGPELPEDFPAPFRAAALGELACMLLPYLPRFTVFIRFDPPWFDAAGGMAEPPELPLRRASANIQPPDTVLLNLDAPPENLLAAMKPKTRYNIRLAEKKVTVCRPDAAGLDQFYKLLRETAVRDGIALHNKNYYQALFDQYAAAKTVRLYLAKHEGDIIAAIIVLHCQKTATYLYGASSNQKRNLMAPYLLQWKAILDAKEAGCIIYDFFGIPPDDNPNHPMAGLFRFKTGFGGRIIHRPGSFDFSYIKPLYALLKFAETARKIARDLKKHAKRGTCHKTGG